MVRWIVIKGNLIEVFIPIILYKFGYSLKEVILYYLIVNLFIVLLVYPSMYIAKKYSNRLLVLTGIFYFVLVQYLLTNLSTIVFAYFYGKKINDKKTNYLSLSIIFIVIVYLLKVSFTNYILVLIAFLEGISTKMYELSISKEMYSLSKKFEYSNYNLVYELVLSVFRSLILIICYFFVDDLKVMIYIAVSFVFISAFIKYKPLK